MATADNTVSGAPPVQAADSGGPQELLADIKKTKEKLEKLEQEIDKLNKRLDDSNFTGTGRYSSAEKVEAALLRLEAEKADLRRLLILDKEKEARLQQQSGAGV